MSPNPSSLLTPAGLRRVPVTIQNPTTTPDGAGGYVETWVDVPTPARLYARVQPIGPADRERSIEGTIAAHATHLVTIPYHAAVTTLTRVVVDGRTLSVLGAVNLDEQNVQLVLTCTELVD